MLCLVEDAGVLDSMYTIPSPPPREGPFILCLYLFSCMVCVTTVPKRHAYGYIKAKNARTITSHPSCDIVYLVLFSFAAWLCTAVWSCG